MYRIMIRDNMHSLAKSIFEEQGEFEIVVDNDKATGTPEALKKIVNEFDGLAIRSGTKLTAEVLASAERLKVIGRAGIGVDNIDVKAATEKGIVVMNAPGGNTVTTGEHAISMMLSLARNIPQATASLRDGKWEKKKFVGIEITGKTLGIVGLGHIGREVASRALGLKMRVIAADPFVTEEAATSIGVELMPIKELLAQSDFISLHVPRLDETKNMINSDMIAGMKKGIRIVNCSRGEVVNLDDLNQALESGHVAGAALDVFPKEPPDCSHPIFSNPHMIFTPHLGASTGEAQQKVADMIARQMSNYLNTGVITNAVNFPSIPQEVMTRLRPYLQLSERLGSMTGQLTRRPNNMKITYSGEVTKFETHILTHAVLKGMLDSFTDRPVNYVNAHSLARDKGMVVEEVKSNETQDYTNLIKIQMPGIDDELNEIWGSIFAKKAQRVVRLGKVYMDAIPEGWMLVIQNHDERGVIGNIGSVLAKHEINIGRFQLGRLEGEAICIVNIDSEAGENVIDEIKSLPNIISVRGISLG